MEKRNHASRCKTLTEGVTQFEDTTHVALGPKRVEKATISRRKIKSATATSKAATANEIFAAFARGPTTTAPQDQALKGSSREDEEDEEHLRRRREAVATCKSQATEALPPSAVIMMHRVAF